MDRSKNISWMPLLVIAAAAFVGALDATFMNVSMSQVVIDLDTNVGTIQKMVSFYTLITASLLLISARLQDIIGKRNIFLLGIIIYSVGDLIAALSPNATVLFIGWSLLEGIGSALMGPALISIITGTYDGVYRTKALAVVSTIIWRCGYNIFLLAFRLRLRVDCCRLCADPSSKDQRFSQDRLAKGSGYYGVCLIRCRTAFTYDGNPAVI